MTVKVRSHQRFKIWDHVCTQTWAHFATRTLCWTSLTHSFVSVRWHVWNYQLLLPITWCKIKFQVVHLSWREPALWHEAQTRNSLTNPNKTYGWYLGHWGYNQGCLSQSLHHCVLHVSIQIKCTTESTLIRTTWLKIASHTPRKAAGMWFDSQVEILLTTRTGNKMKVHQTNVKKYISSIAGRHNTLDQLVHLL